MTSLKFSVLRSQSLGLTPAPPDSWTPETGYPPKTIHLGNASTSLFAGGCADLSLCSPIAT